MEEWIASSEVTMSVPRTNSPRRFWQLKPRPQVRLVPSLFSLLFHSVLLIILAVSYRGRGDGGLGRGPGEFTTIVTREDGVVNANPWGDRPDAQIEGAPNDFPPGDLATGSTAGNEVLKTTSTIASEAPPAEVLLPTADGSSAGATRTNLPTVGSTGSPLGGVGSTGGNRPPATGTRGTPDGVVGGGAAGGGSGTGFFGISDRGTKVVYVVDASGSMTSYNAMQVAKSELMASLQGLNERQQFLIIFYEDKPHVVKLGDELKPTLAYATEINKTLARQKIAGIQPGSGTDHLPALEMAMKLNPDVIFFLTDALDPPLWPRDLEKIKLANNGRTRIHSIEFGQGSELPEANDQGNFLRRLARLNGGTYRYHDVTRFKSISLK